MKRFILPIIITFISLLCLHGQHPELRFNHLGVEDGLSHSLVSAMVEDTLGYIWFGKQDGLNRYDGYNFRTYHRGAGDRTPSDSWICSHPQVDRAYKYETFLCEDQHLDIGTKTELNLINLKDGTTRTFNNSREL